MQVVNHGISQSVMKGALEAASDFFALSKEAKGQFASDDIRRPVRYETGTKDGKARSFLKHYAHPLSDWIHLWPAEPPSYREKMGMFAIEARKLALQLMDAILESLGLGPAYLRKELEEGMQMLAVNGYPQFSQPDVMVGLFPHSDYGFITILLQSCNGLEVMDHDDKCWRAVPHQPEALHVHIGDHLEVLSNGEFKTLIHRAVLNPDNRRISIASIHGLSIDEKVSTAKELLDGQQPKRYEDSSFRDYLDYLHWKIKNQRSFIDSLKIGRA
ncbi:Hyoscyamine 6-dioxygenase [Ananas comosus]|uniref:Hyoscyamine 6-dioxygenase n=1 Tax=Ananas comosus TaxID=4615 RepID=A0A199UY95_ANACO|nr:Hyoscyamine 6-dioxygenase [Ananas comosus]